MPDPEPRCYNCGEPESKHCVFEAPPPTPAGCVCDPREWSYEIPKACDKFIGNKGQRCRTCEHDEACHKKAH